MIQLGMTSAEHTKEVQNSYEDLHTDQDVYRVQRYDHYTIYTKNGMKHRVHGPALSIGDKEWFYINGYLKTPDEHATYRSLHNSYSNAPIYTSMGVDIKEEELYYLMASESPTSIYTTTSATSTID